MKSIVWEGDRPISAGWAYSSGALHASYDVPMPNGTKLFSPCSGEVLDLVTGVPNVPGGSVARRVATAIEMYSVGELVANVSRALFCPSTPMAEKWARSSTRAPQVTGRSVSRGRPTCS